MWQGDEKTLLVFHENNLSAAYVESLLFGLSKVPPLIKCKLRIVDERVVGVILLLILLLNECGRCKKDIRTERNGRLTHLLCLRLPSSPSSPSPSLVSRLCTRTGGVGERRPAARGSCGMSTIVVVLSALFYFVYVL